jgi:hypothetical protein
MNCKYTKEYIQQKITILKDNYIYRINDSFNLSTTHKINREIMDNDQYNNTILRNFLKTYDKKNKFESLFNSVKSYIDNNKIRSYDDNYLVVHLRMGDYITKESKYDNIVKRIYDRVKEQSSIKFIVFVVAFHFGQPEKSNEIYSSGRYSYKESHVVSNVELLHKIIHEMKLPVVIESSNNVDHDLCILVCASNLLISYGGFGILANKLNNRYIGKKEVIDTPKFSNNTVDKVKTHDKRFFLGNLK